MVAVSCFPKIYRAGLVDATAARFLQKAAATAIAKLVIDKVEMNGRINRRRLLLSLKLRGSAMEAVALGAAGFRERHEQQEQLQHHQFSLILFACYLFVLCVSIYPFS